MLTAEKELDFLLKEAALRGKKAAERYPEQRFFGYLCSYYPEELILAAGLEPLRLLPGSGPATPAELPSYCCSLARGTLAEAKKGKSGLVGVGMAHTCDTMQCLDGIWADCFGRENVLPIVPPVLLNAPGGLRYYQSEMEALSAKLVRLSEVQKSGQDRSSEPKNNHGVEREDAENEGNRFESEGEGDGEREGERALERAWQVCTRARQLAAELDELRSRLPSPLVSALLRAGQLLPKERFITALETVLPLLHTKARENSGRYRVLVSGAVLESDSLFQMVEDLNGRVVADDTCTGYRHYAQNTVEGSSVRIAEEESKDAGNPRNLDDSKDDENLRDSQYKIINQIVQRYVNMPPCPCRSQGLEKRLDYLEALALERGAQAAILVIRKYCEPHAWDSVPLRERLEAKGIRTLVLELEASELGGQERTRLQAFLESLGN